MNYGCILLESDGLETGGAALVLQEISDIGRQQIEGGWYLSLTTPETEKGTVTQAPSWEFKCDTHGVLCSICEPTFNLFLVLLEFQFKGVEVGGKEK